MALLQCQPADSPLVASRPEKCASSVPQGVCFFDPALCNFRFFVFLQARPQFVPGLLAVGQWSAAAYTCSKALSRCFFMRLPTKEHKGCVNTKNTLDYAEIEPIGSHARPEALRLRVPQVEGAAWQAALSAGPRNKLWNTATGHMISRMSDEPRWGCRAHMIQHTAIGELPM